MYIFTQKNVELLRQYWNKFQRAQEGAVCGRLTEGKQISYRTHITHELNEQYESCRVNIFKQFMDPVYNDKGVSNALIMPDEAHAPVT
jgi:hypothetical protein